MIEQSGGPGRGRIPFMVTQTLGLASPADFFRQHCGDLVELKEAVRQAKVDDTSGTKTESSQNELHERVAGRMSCVRTHGFQ